MANHPMAEFGYKGGQYISPGVQIGYIFNKGWFAGVQITYSQSIDRTLHLVGLSAGARVYHKEIVLYSDVQHTMGFLFGYGIGGMWRVKKHTLSFKGIRFKSWAGLYGLATFDYLMPSNRTNYGYTSLGIMHVMPKKINNH